MNTTLENRKSNVLRPYMVYVISFVGAGMVSGGVVHYPLNENFYGILAILGGIVFVLASLFNELLSGKGLPKAGALLSLVLTSLLLSFGIGMLSGGIQHFTDFPTRAALLIPAGISLSFVAFCFKARLFNRESAKKVLIAGSLVFTTAIASLLVLTNVAADMNAPEHTHEMATSDSSPATEDHTLHPHSD